MQYFCTFCTLLHSIGDQAGCVIIDANSSSNEESILHQFQASNGVQDTRSDFDMISQTAVTGEQNQQLDLSIFDDCQSYCQRGLVQVPLTESCAHIKRLCTASMYSHKIKTSTTLNDEDKRALLVEFNKEIYLCLLDDSIHFVKEHDNEIKRVHTEWTEKYGVPKCSVSDCAQTARHCARKREERKEEIEDSVYSFYESIYDQLHHFVFHLFEIGMRVEMPSMTEHTEEEKEVNLDGVIVDKWFAAERNRIRLRREECKLNLNQSEEANNKYMIQIVSGKEGQVTLMDALFQKLLESIKIQRKALQRIREYFEKNAFDSDCIEMDIEDVTDSNIWNFIQHQATVQTMSDFIRSTKCMSLLLHLKLFLFASPFVHQSSISHNSDKYTAADYSTKSVQMDTLRIWQICKRYKS